MMSVGISSKADENGMVRLDCEGMMDVESFLRRAVEKRGDFVWKFGNWTLGWDPVEHKKIMDRIAEKMDGGSA